MKLRETELAGEVRYDRVDGLSAGLQAGEAAWFRLASEEVVAADSLGPSNCCCKVGCCTVGRVSKIVRTLFCCVEVYPMFIGRTGIADVLLVIKLSL